MPLFVTPGVGDTLGPPDPVAEAWKARVDRWRNLLMEDDTDTAVLREAVGSGLRPMPIPDQMRLQWTLVAAGIAQVEADYRKQQ